MHVTRNVAAVWWGSTDKRWNIRLATTLVSFALALNYMLKLSQAAIGPACQCVEYTKEHRQEGIFKSPNFPAIYASNIYCLLYTFAAPHNFIVELTFVYFDLAPPTFNRCGDYLRFYADLKSSTVSENSSYDLELCGHMMVKKTYYSRYSFFAIEFHTDSYQGNYTGFCGKYKFISKDMFQTTGGSRHWGSECMFDFYGSAGVKQGKFFSPMFPWYYPPRAHCQYRFFGKPGEKVNIVFESIELEYIDASCSASPDYIVVRDGADSLAPVIEQFCNTRQMAMIKSSSENLYVEFAADDRRQMQGFSASYEFISDKDTDHMVSDTPGCSFRFTSVQGKTGNFQSLNHPSPYPAGTVCRYNFQGQGKERVQIAFLTLDLYHPSGNASDPNDCITNSDADVIRVSIIQDGKPEEIAVLCGGVRPKTFMSSNTQLQVVFISRSIQSMATGFKANFSFVTNFGITSGQQNTDLACSFTFQSDRTSNGTFTSPNFPGLYPRSTDCHYLFYGETNQRVYIKFTYFEVDGIRPGCTDSTHSDYVELSNFDAITDRKMERLCSADLPEKERSVLSDRSFFRVTFHSNSKYDLTGFSAFYQFRTYDDASSQRRHEELVDLKLNSAASSSAPSSLPLSLPMSLAILLSPVACLYAPVATLIIYP